MKAGRWTVSRGVAISLAVALAVNLFLIFCYFWGQGGGRNVVEIEARGNSFRAVIDGTASAPHTGGSFSFDAFPNGTLELFLVPPAPTLPRPSGIDSIEVRDINDGRLLFREDFDGFNDERWQVVSGRFEVRDGALRATELYNINILRLNGGDFRDAVVRVSYRNALNGTIGTRVRDGGAVYYSFELVRDFPNFFDVMHGGVRGGNQYGGLIQTDALQSTRSMASMLSQAYPTLLLVVLVTLGLTLLLARVVPNIDLWRFAKLKPYLPLVLVAVIAALAFTASHHVNTKYYESIPHTPDEVAYIFQGELLAKLQTTAPLPPVKEAFYFYNPSFMHEHGDRWASFYPFGHPLVLAMGARIGLAWLVPMVVGALSVVLVFLVGRRLYGPAVGVLAAGLLAASPFFIMQAANYMSHNTNAAILLGALLLILRGDRPIVFGLAAGLLFGLALNTRPLSAVALVPVYGVLLLTYAIDQTKRRDAALNTAAFCAGGAVMVLASLLYNQALTGDFFATAYAGDVNQSDLIGFTGGHTFDVGMRNQQAELMALLMVFNGLPAHVGLLLVLLPFALGSRNRWDYFCLACAVSITGIHVLYRYSGIYEGPRYWYEAMPFLVLLAARGAQVVASLATDAAATFWSQGRTPRPPARWPSQVLVYGVVAGLTVYACASWLYGWEKPWAGSNAPLIPSHAAEAKGIFGVDARLLKLKETTTLANALILVRPCSYFTSPHCYGSVFLENTHDYDGPIVWALYIPARNAELIAAFPGRTVYVADFDAGGTLEPYRPDRP